MISGDKMSWRLNERKCLCVWSNDTIIKQEHGVYNHFVLWINKYRSLSSKSDLLCFRTQTVSSRHWGSDRRPHRVKFSLSPGCSHLHGPDIICWAEPLNPILIPAKPNRQLREPIASILWEPLDQSLGEGGGILLHCCLFAASLEQPLLCEIQERAHREEQIKDGNRRTWGRSLGDR